MASGIDDEALRAKGKPGTEAPRDNVVTLIPKARIEMARKKRIAKLSELDQKAETPARDGNDDPGPSAA